MAAKVVMVAVPTVLGIASIRVYKVSEAPTDGLITREKLNIYTPLTPTAQAQFVPDRPGVIESGLTTARETVLPFVQAVKGACVSVKTGTINLYHTGEDVYYYLKDPPPGFLPRYGTITMAGLLGMFLARRGSRLKRIALPLGLMSVAGSVCYPAQTVAVLKVTGKKMYAAGQWSSAAVSSLLASKPKEIPASPPQAAPVPPNQEPAAAEEAQSAPCHASEPSSTTDSSVHSAAISDTQMESAESVPASDEPIIAVTTEEPSETHAEISADEAPTHSDLQAASVPADTEIAPPAEELPAPAESEASAPSTQASEDAGSTASVEAPVEVPSPSEEPEPLAESAPVEVLPPLEEAAAPELQVEPTPIEVPSPSEETPAPEPQVESAPVEGLPPMEEPPALEATVETTESGAAAQPELADKPPVAAAAEETLIPTHTPPPPEHPTAKTSKGGSGFKADPALMDFGQSSPEDEDLYSTRS